MNKRRGRPHRCRHIGLEAEFRHFRPADAETGEAEQLVLSLDELEALRLADYEGLYHCDAARHMQVSRQTFGRILASAHRTVAAALLGGKEILVQGGSVMQTSQNMGHDGNCICVSCGHKKAHEAGHPCREERCPSCGKAMLREGSAHHKAFLEKQQGKQK
ncbi:DUF134 domain-containing protein [bacterium]|nr:DUF134 domain-containing protein [bacterium]